LGAVFVIETDSVGNNCILGEERREIANWRKGSHCQNPNS
jgi:hypothetical protein